MVAALLGALGVALGALLRNQVVAIVGVLVLSLVIEPVVLGLTPDVGRFSPFRPLPTAASGLSADEALGLEGVDLIAPGLAVLAMLAWIGVACAAGRPRPPLDEGPGPSPTGWRCSTRAGLQALLARPPRNSSTALSPIT